jgi:seryl-tRNA synthetase
VVTYVANADNYRDKYDQLKSDRDSLNKKVNDLTGQVNEKIAKKEQLEDELNKKITSLKTQVTELQGKFDASEREKSLLLQKVNSFASIVEGFTQTTDQQGLLLKNTLSELNKVQADQLKQRKELDETTSTLVEKMAIIETLEAKAKRLLEEKSELQNKLDKLLMPSGRVATAPVPVTQLPDDKAKAVSSPATTELNLHGSVTAVDLKNSMASISVGKADGVKTGMRFHVTRGDNFLCDILIIEVDAEQSVGVLELMQQQPQVGDSVSTNL